MPVDTIPSRLLKRARRHPDAPAYYAREGGRWVPASWAHYAREVRQAARALIARGVGPGRTVAILGFNKPEWVIFDLACMMVGGAPAGIYTTCSAEEVQYIVHHAESPVVLVEHAAQWEKLKARRDQLPLLGQVVLMKGAPGVDDPLVVTWEEFLAQGDAVAESAVDERVAALEPEGLATLIYTSGTTGPPKGVMLSHRNLTWTADVARDLVGARMDDRSLSYLPLSHIAEQMFSIHGHVAAGYPVYYAESLERLPDNLKEVQPTVFFGVPRIWEKLHAGINAKLQAATGVKKLLVEQAMRVGREASARLCAGEPLGFALAAQYALMRRLVFSKLHQAIGLGSARACVSGAAPVAKEVLDFFASLDVRISEVYGQSEDTGPTTFNQAGRMKLGTVGTPLPGLDVVLASDDEILVRGPNVFLGYYKDPEATAEALKDGWLHSGDLGAFDRDGYLSITGRKKDILITSGGKNIAPKNIESALKQHPLVGEAVVIGDRRKYLTALLTLDPEAVAGFLRARGEEALTPHAHPEVRAELQRAVDEVNHTLARVESIKRFTVLPSPFSVEGGELTPTLKVKRKFVQQRYALEIDAMYAE